MDSLHLNGETATSRKICRHLMKEHAIEVHQSTISCVVNWMGMSWKLMKGKKMTFRSQHNLVLCKFLIQLKLFIKEQREEYVLVFTDESYIHQNHKSKSCYQTQQQAKEGNKNRKNAKGRCPIIMHAITTEGPLTTYTEDRLPVDNLECTGNTSHPTTNADKLATEDLSVSDLHTGDYHDNMKSTMFLQWMREKLMPTFDKIYPNKKIILVVDNAPYHQKRQVGLFGNLKNMN